MFSKFLNKRLERFFVKLYESWYENYKGLTKNPRWLLMRKTARFKIIRSLVRYFFRERVKSYFTINTSNSYFADIDVHKVINNLQNQGLYLGINLPESVVQEIVEFAEATPCYGNRQLEFGFFYHQKEYIETQLGKRFVVANYFNTALLCPAIKNLQNDPKLLAIAARYLNAQPVHLGNDMWWSFAGDLKYHQKSKAAQLFHYDLDDYHFLKFFFYLTDVDEQSGSHVCVCGSHNNKKMSHLWQRNGEREQDIIDYYGLKSLVSICGKAGFGFAEDPLCFHKGITPTHRDRLILQIEFATTDYRMQNDFQEADLLKCIQ
jgi:uncharacterized protein YcgL (UPF0745 family)